MDRRSMLGLLGAAGVGMGLSPGVGTAQERGNGGANDGRPVDGFKLHFCGIHVAKNDRQFQLITQHYCGQRGNIHQCLLFDSREPDAKLLGVEYIIPNDIYVQLPSDEKKYWHPHTYEVLAGGLIAPGMTDAEELAFMKALLTTWGKTWHTWPDPTTDIPLGDPLLMWALTADDHVNPDVVRKRDQEFGVDGRKIREVRTKAIGYDVPSVSFPTSIEQVGRQWCDSGPDQPRNL